MKPDEPLAFHILRHCLQKILTEDFEVLRALGLSFEQLRTMEALSFKELIHLSRLGPRFLGIALDPQGLTLALRHIRQEADSEALQDEMLFRRAPFPMMQALFGTTSQQYAHRRKLLGLSASRRGRPPAPTDEEHERVWQAWQSQAALPEQSRYLMVSRLTQVNLHTIWTLVNEWKTTATKRHVPSWSTSG